jgi:DNA mismatch repair protein MutS2
LSEVVGLSWGAGGSAAAPGRAFKGVGASSSTLTKSIPAELNLIGLTVEEAMERVDKVLDDASLSERREIRLVHGFGTGRLRRAVAELLDGHALVASWRPGGPSEGGGGATVVELKD